MDAQSVYASRQLAEAVALQVGGLLRSRPATWAKAEHLTAHDTKLVGDRGAEAVAADMLIRGSGVDVYSEEAGLLGDAGGDIIWILDPLDGSANYARGVPQCCISIALCVSGVPKLGVIYDFNRNELFTGIASKGAWLNGVPMTVSNVVRPDEALLTTGFPVAMDYESDAPREYVDAVRAYRKVRSLGTAATMLAYVAAGRFDIYRERSVRFWDVAAGIAMVLGAGGQVRVENFDDDPAGKLDLTAYNGVLNL